MNTILLGLALFASSAHAAPGARIACLGRAHGATVYIEANLISLQRLDHVKLAVYSGHHFYDQRDRLEGAREAAGETRFYLHSGNTSTFLALPDNELGGARAILAATDRQLRDGSHDRRYAFAARYVFEQYERGGSQDVTALACGPKALGETE